MSPCSGCHSNLSFHVLLVPVCFLCLPGSSHNFKIHTIVCLEMPIQYSHLSPSLLFYMLLDIWVSIWPRVQARAENLVMFQSDGSRCIRLMFKTYGFSSASMFKIQSYSDSCKHFFLRCHVNIHNKYNIHFTWSVHNHLQSQHAHSSILVLSMGSWSGTNSKQIHNSPTWSNLPTLQEGILVWLRCFHLKVDHRSKADQIFTNNLSKASPASLRGLRTLVLNGFWSCLLLVSPVPLTISI